MSTNRHEVMTRTLDELAAAEPDAVLLQDVAGRSMTVEEFRTTTLRWASAYRRLGLGPGDTVLTMLPTSLDAYPAWLGAAWLRAIEVPVNTMFRGHMLRYLIQNSQARVLIVAERYLDQLREVADGLTDVETIVVLDATAPPDGLPATVIDGIAFLDGAEPADDLAHPEPWDIACMIYTSGTTGPSKGVLMPWRELWSFITSYPDGMLEPGRGLYLVLPVFHVSGKQGVWAAAEHRCRLVIRESFSLTEFWKDIRDFDCTATGLIGIMASLLVRMPPVDDEKDTPLRATAMGPMIPELDEFRERFGVRVFSGYGMTEIGVPLGTDGFNVADWRSCGRPHEGYELRIVDEHDEPLGPDTVGELIVRTERPWMLNAGYWQMPDKTAEAWRNGWFHTGDGMKYDAEGNFYFVDRIKDALRRRGENISSFEVEGYVGEHEAVMECAAIAVPSELSEDDLKICVVLKPDHALTPRELWDFLAPRMPRFMLPRYIEICASLPKTPTLRIQKVELRKSALNDNTWDREKEGVPLPS
jgi:carnitine-CoA ligase